MDRGGVFQLPPVFCKALPALSCFPIVLPAGLELAWADSQSGEGGFDTLHSLLGRASCAACVSLVTQEGAACGVTRGTGGAVDVRIIKSKLLLNLGCLCRRWIFSKLLWVAHKIFAKRILF